jgi:Tfp pilus assembly protein PilZ
MKEKRAYPRFSVEELDFRTSTVVSTEVDIHDISPTGVAVSGSKRLNIGREYTLKFGDKDDMLPVKGIVKWEVLAGNREASQEEVIPIYLAGIEFKDVLTEKAAHLIDFIKKIVDVKDERLKGIRFKIRTHEKAVLCCMETYSVKLISLGGMLIETKHELPVEDTFPMELTFPDDDIPIHFRGRIACCQEVQTEGVRHYKTGIEFINMETGDKSRIEAFVDLI